MLKTLCIVRGETHLQLQDRLVDDVYEVELAGPGGVGLVLQNAAHATEGWAAPHLRKKMLSVECIKHVLNFIIVLLILNDF